MTSDAVSPTSDTTFPVHVDVEPAIENRDRLTTAFRFFLAIPHAFLVGGPLAAGFSWSQNDGAERYGGGASGGLLGIAAGVVSIISWFAILFTGKHPDGLWKFSRFYLGWRVRAFAYMTLLRDEFPPLGDGEYEAWIDVAQPEGPRDRLTVLFRAFMAIPHFFAIWAIDIAWFCTTVFAWFSIVFTGNYPAGLYDFGVGALRWNARLEAYLLLLRDEYPPFSLK